MSPTSIQDLQNIVGAEHVVTDHESFLNYAADWTHTGTPAPSAIVFPTTTEQIQQLVLWARKTKSPLVPSGGRTGMSGGATAYNQEVVVSLERMNKILHFDPIEKTVLCQGGVITEDLQNFALEQNLFYPVDFAARGSSHLAGNVATNAGGIKVIRYGLTRNWVAGLTVVTGQGEILKLNNGLVKNATGYDLRHLFIGSEGTLGFITEVLVRLTHQPSEPTVFVLGVPHLEHIMHVFKAFTHELEVNAFEFFTELALKHVVQNTGLSRPFATACDYYVLIELENKGDNLQKAEEVFSGCLESQWVVDGVMSQSPAQAKTFWRLREDISEAVSHYKPYKNDISVRISKVPEFLQKLDQVFSAEYPHFEVVWFGHIGDGNLHINILKPDSLSMPDFLAQCRQVDKLLMHHIEALGGSVSAEHGVGIIKRDYLQHTRSQDEINIMKQIKNIFDPDKILNPGKLLV